MIYGANNILKIQRMLVDGENKESFDSSYILSNEPCYIEPMDAVAATILDQQNAFKMFKIYLDGKLDIREGDKCFDAQENKYYVKGVAIYPNNTDTGDITELTTVKVFPDPIL